MLDEYRRSSWLELARKYGAQQWHAFGVNLRKLYGKVLPLALSPLALLWLPLVVGLVGLWREQRLLELAALALFAVPYLVIIPAIILHARYIYPVAVVCLPVMGVGLARMVFGASSFGPWVRRESRVASVLIAVLTIAHGAHKARHFRKRRHWEGSYREACQWIRQTHGSDLEFRVMARYLGAYAWLKRELIYLPVDDLERLVRYCRHTNTRYILFSTIEAKHNRHLDRVFRREKRKSVRVDGATLRIAHTFRKTGKKPGKPVHLIEVVLERGSPEQ